MNKKHILIGFIYTFLIISILFLNSIFIIHIERDIEINSLLIASHSNLIAYETYKNIDKEKAKEYLNISYYYINLTLQKINK